MDSCTFVPGLLSRRLNHKCRQFFIRKEVAFSSSKALLYNVNGEIFATSHLCPHYKAPLVKGVLSIDGDKARVECPWVISIPAIQVSERINSLRIKAWRLF
jgi:hypothetical protein